MKKNNNNQSDDIPMNNICNEGEIICNEDTCSKIFNCISLGKEKKIFNEYFNYFKIFNANNNDYIIKNEVYINSGANNSVDKYSVIKNKIKAYFILKKNLIMNNDADNLAYEYLVGKFLNNYIYKYPFLLETYNLVYNNNNFKEQEVQYYIDDNNIENILTISCTKDLQLCIEYINEPFTMADYMYYDNLSDENHNPKHKKYIDTKMKYFNYETFLNIDLFYILYQVYFTLHSLSKNFTHNDLHLNNVLIYVPDPNKYIEYEFYGKTKTTTFKSQYMIKIIDYGRSYFYENKENNSITILEKLKKIKDCEFKQNNNIYYKGFYYIINKIESNKKNDKNKWFNIFKNKPGNNPNKDLNFLNGINYELNKIYNFDNNMKIKNFNGININTVSNAYHIIKEIINEPGFSKNDENIQSLKKLGTLKIYTDGNKDCEFIRETEKDKINGISEYYHENEENKSFDYNPLKTNP